MRQAWADGIFELASVDPRVVFVGSDLGPGAMEPMRLRYPERFFMEGVSEQYIIGMAAGLAATGFIPFVNSIGTFLTCRGFEQIAIDLCLQNLPVRLIGNGGGLVYASLGPTHLATEDLAILTVLPNMTVVAPCDSDEAVALLGQSLDWPGPVYFRLGGADAPAVSLVHGPPSLGRGAFFRPPARPSRVHGDNYWERRRRCRPADSPGGRGRRPPPIDGEAPGRTPVARRLGPCRLGCRSRGTHARRRSSRRGT